MKFGLFLCVGKFLSLCRFQIRVTKIFELDLGPDPALNYFNSQHCNE